MIAYNNDWLNNLLVREQADRASESNCISKEEKAKLYAAYPSSFYSPNVFVRTGLFVLTCIIVFFTMGLASLVFFTASRDDAFGGLFIFFGLLAYGGLELMVTKHHYKSGVDDALMWTAGGCLVAGLNMMTHIPAQTNAVVVLILSAYFFLRFTNAVMASIAGLALFAAIFFSVIRFGALTKAITPFVIMVASAFIYFFIQPLLQQKKWKHYANGLLLLSITALLCFYVAGNYFAVREASAAMFNLDLKEGKSIPMGWLFWIFTITIPVLYIFRGIQTKDAVLLRVGLLLVAALVFTVRYYYHLLPPETAMVTGGIVFICFAYVLIRYLHQPRYGFTDKAPDEPFFMDKLQVESLLIAETFSSPQLPADKGTQFGGGTGGGGGASGEF